MILQVIEYARTSAYDVMKDELLNMLWIRKVLGVTRE